MMFWKTSNDIYCSKCIILKIRLLGDNRSIISLRYICCNFHVYSQYCCDITGKQEGPLAAPLSGFGSDAEIDDATHILRA